MKKYLQTLVLAILAGISIGIGGTVFLSVDNKIVGALLFAVGLLTIVGNGLNLYTGKIGYLFDNKPAYIIDLILIWIGNLAGAAGIGYAIRATRIAGIAEKAEAMCQTKLADDPLSILILAIGCGILMYVAVDGNKVNPNNFAKSLVLVFCVAVFILCSFEHCVANMFYFSVSNSWSAKTFGYLLIMTLGNSIGGVLIPVCKKLTGAAAVQEPQKKQVSKKKEQYV